MQNLICTLNTKADIQGQSVNDQINYKCYVFQHIWSRQSINKFIVLRMRDQNTDFFISLAAALESPGG